MPIGRSNPTKHGWLPWKRYAESTISGTMILSPDFRDFFASLNEARVRYLVVGGYKLKMQHEQSTLLP